MEWSALPSAGKCNGIGGLLEYVKASFRADEAEARAARAEFERDEKEAALQYAGHHWQGFQKQISTLKSQGERQERMVKAFAGISARCEARMEHWRRRARRWSR